MKHKTTKYGTTNSAGSRRATSRGGMPLLQHTATALYRTQECGRPPATMNPKARATAPIVLACLATLTMVDIIVVYEEIDGDTVMPWTAYEVAEP